MLPLGSIFKKYSISYPFYADDTQMYLPMKSVDDTSMKSLSECLNLYVKCWMNNNFFQLNEKKTEMIIFGPSSNANNIAMSLGPRSSYLHTYVKNMGFIFDTELKLDKQINSVFNCKILLNLNLP